MKFLATSDHDPSQEREFRLVFTGRDLARMKPTSVDRALFDECDKSNKISDKLLALERMARLIEAEE